MPSSTSLNQSFSVFPSILLPIQSTISDGVFESGSSTDESARTRLINSAPVRTGLPC
jgi:hypothetical protein